MAVSEYGSERSGVGSLAGRSTRGAAADVAEILAAAVGGPLPIGIRCWDGSTAGATDAPATIVLRDPRALRRLLWSPNELGLVRAYVSGDLDLEGDLFAVLDLPEVIDRVAHHEPIAHPLPLTGAWDVPAAGLTGSAHD